MHCFQGPHRQGPWERREDSRQGSPSQEAAEMRGHSGSEAPAPLPHSATCLLVAPLGSAPALAPLSPPRGCHHVLREADIQHVGPRSGSLNFAIAAAHLDGRTRGAGRLTFSLLKQEESRVAVTDMRGAQILPGKTVFWEKNIPRREGDSPGPCASPPPPGLPPSPPGDTSRPRQPSRAPFHR